MDTSATLESMTANLRQVNDRVDVLLAERDRMRSTLLWLDAQGGLGYGKHEAIKAALNVPYPRFCHHADKCAGKGRCMSGSVCND